MAKKAKATRSAKTSASVPGLKKPKLKKYPKKPKQSASTASLENYVSRCKAVDNENRAIMQDYDRERRKRTSVLSQVAKLK